MRRFVIASMIILGACASHPPVTELPESSDPSSEISRVENKLKDAESRQVDALSPRNFEEAKEALDDARKQREKRRSNKDILYSVALADAYLTQAENAAKIGSDILPGALKERKNAIAAGAPILQAEEFKAADIELRRTTRSIEAGDIAKARKSAEKLQRDFNAVELMAIKKAALGDAYRDLNQAIKEGAPRLTPQTLDWAKNRIGHNDALIESSRHDQSAVQRASQDARAAATRLLERVRRAKHLSDKNPEQLSAIVEEDRAAVAEAEQALATNQGVVAQLSADREKLQSTADLEKDYEKVREEFSNEEAEVFKQGNRILVRLRGLNFPLNKADITPDNYSLLGKVQKAIRQTDPKEVVIEGHTDSLGGAKINQPLSQARADAVKEYLTANNTIAPEKIRTEGLGYSKPLASNKTAAGRAQNRRVDIILNE